MKITVDIVDFLIRCSKGPTELPFISKNNERSEITSFEDTLTDIASGCFVKKKVLRKEKNRPIHQDTI
jgi:hypothetical protein